MGKYQARIAGNVIAARAGGATLDTGAWGEHAMTADHHAVPQVVFTDPQVAHVGTTADQARESGVSVRTVEIDIAVAGSSLHADGYDGAAVLVVDTAREVPVGATFVGQDVSELVHSATVAIAGEVPLGRLWHAVPSFPTISEVWLRLLESYRAG
jgi:dihydrolipoamide dehydrogenase